MMLGCLPLALASDQPLGKSATSPSATTAIGQIVNSSGTSLNGVALPAGGTLTSGGTLATAERGTALVKFSAGSQVTLGERSQVSFQSKDGRVIADIASGSLAAQAPADGTLVVETARYTIQPASGPAAYGVAMLPDKNTEVVARRGPVSITEKSSGRKYVVEEGHYAEVAGATASGQAQGAGPATAGVASAPPGLLASGPLMFVISVGVGVGTGFGIGEGALAEPGPPASPSTP